MFSIFSFKIVKEASMKTTRNLTVFSIIVVLILSASIGYMKGFFDGQTRHDMSFVATAEAKKQDSIAPNQWSPTKPYPKHNVYYPGTEELKP